MDDERATTEVLDGYSSGLLTRRQALVRLGVLGLGMMSASTLLSACKPTKPNFLLIIADDMRLDQLPYMSVVQNQIVNAGRTFTQARCNVPLCQPNRVGLFTGQMSKHNNELTVGSPTQFHAVDNTIAKWMSDAGYVCGHFGKYHNFWDGFGGINAPAGYQTWREVISEPSINEVVVHLETGKQTFTGQYGTDYLATEASAFINSATAPFFCVVAPRQPHAPYFPRPDLADDWLDVVWPIVDEVDVSDKPSWIQALPPLTETNIATIRNDAIGALQELSAVDDMVGQILANMSSEVLAKTVVIFTSDNGVHRGEHRRSGSASKAGPYEVGLHVPLVVRGPGFNLGANITAPSMVMQDITATLLDFAGATAGLPNQAGTSLYSLRRHPEDYTDRILLHEVGQGFYNQTGDGMTTGPDSPYGFRKLYRYPSVRANPAGPFTYEAYDLDTDSDELSNWADDPDRRAERDALETELLNLLQ